MSEVIDTSATSVFVDGDGVLHVVSNGTPSSATTVQETVAAVTSLLSRPAPSIFDARKWPKASTDAWTALIDALPAIVSAAAILVEPGGESQLGGFPAAVNRLMFPLVVFTDEAEAMQYLHQFIPGDQDLEEE